MKHFNLKNFSAILRLVKLSKNCIRENQTQKLPDTNS